MEWSELQVATFAGMAAGFILMIVAVIGVGLCYHRPRLGRAFRCHGDLHGVDRGFSVLGLEGDALRHPRTSGERSETRRRLERQPQRQRRALPEPHVWFRNTVNGMVRCRFCGAPRTSGNEHAECGVRVGPR